MMFWVKEKKQKFDMEQFDQKINGASFFCEGTCIYEKEYTPISPYYTVSTEAVSTAVVAWSI